MKITVTGSFELDFHGLTAVQADIHNINLSDNTNNSLSLITSGDLETNHQLSMSGSNNNNNDVPAWMRSYANLRPEVIIGYYRRQTEVGRYNLYAGTVVDNQSIIRALVHKHDIIGTQRLTIAYKENEIADKNREIADKNRQIEELKNGLRDYQNRGSKGRNDQHAPNTTHKSTGFAGSRTSTSRNTNAALPPAPATRSAGLPDFNLPLPSHLEPSHGSPTSDPPISVDPNVRLNPTFHCNKSVMGTTNASAQPNSSDAHSGAAKPAAANADEEDDGDKKREAKRAKITPSPDDGYNPAQMMNDPIYDFPGTDSDDGDKKPKAK